MLFFFPFKTDVHADIIFRFYKVQVEECFWWCFFFFFCISQDRMIERDQTREWKSLSEWNFLCQNLLKQHGQVLFF